MLPGFRFLLAAIVLSVSIVTFGLGAAALLRAAHEEFASIPARRATPEPYFAQASDAPAATLAMLRLEPAPQISAPVNLPASALAEEPPPEAVPVPKVEMEKLAALNVDAAPPAELAKPELAASDPPVIAAPTEEAPADTRLSALDATSPAPASQVEDTTPPSELIVMPALTDGSVPAVIGKPVAKVAALANPAASIAAEETKKPTAKPDRSEIRKKQRAERARERRRLAARRARLAAQQAAPAAPTAAVQQPADLFGEGSAQSQPAAATRRRR